METNVNYTIVGIFVITLLSALIFAIIWLSSGLSLERYTTYMLYMQESVSGLTIDSPVEFNGVAVGTVTQISLNKRNPQLVEVLMKINSDTPITQGTVATLNSKGVTGITFVALKDKSTDLRPLVAVHGDPYPVIRTGPSFFTRVDTALSQLSANLHDVSRSLQSLLDQQNQQSIKDILLNLRVATGSMVDGSRQLNILLRNTNTASHQLAPLLQSSASTMRILETQTLPATYRLLTNLDLAAQGVAQVTTEIKQNPSVLIRGISHQALGPGEKQ